MLVLTALCGVVYFTGLTARGLANWQEAQRAQAAREMQQRGDWIVPTIEGRPYLAKPPLFYWCQLAIAGLRGAPTGELDIRLSVALAGWLGVLGTYTVTRRLLAPGSDSSANAGDEDYPRRAAWWAALMLATGVLYVRRSRIGELDIVLVPFTVLAVGALHAAWRSHVERGRTHWGAVTAAALAGVGAILAKGPPALLPIALGGYGGMALAPVMDRLLRGPDGGGAPVNPRRVSVGAALGAAGFAAAGVASSWAESGPVDRVLGGALLVIMGGLTGGFIGALLSRAMLAALWGALKRTHPVFVLGLPAAALWAWLAAARARIGSEHVLGTIQGEARDNLRLFLLESPVNNLEATAYGVGLGSAASLMAWVWLARRRPRVAPGLAFLSAWTVLSLIAFSTLGKGVPRYLTPVWPAIASLGGAWLAWRPGGRPRPALLRVTSAGIIVALAASQAVWYGVLGARQELTPREFIAELLEPRHGVDPSRLAMFEFDTPQVDYYVGRSVRSYLGAPNPDLAGVGPANIVEIVDLLRRDGGTYTLLVRRAQPEFLSGTPAAVERLRHLGLIVEEVPIASRFTIDNGRTEVAAVRVRAGP